MAIATFMTANMQVRATVTHTCMHVKTRLPLHAPGFWASIVASAAIVIATVPLTPVPAVDQGMRLSSSAIQGVEQWRHAPPLQTPSSLAQPVPPPPPLAAPSHAMLATPSLDLSAFHQQPRPQLLSLIHI